MEFTTLNLGLFFLAIFLGLKHAFDADHLVAVSSLLTRTNNTKRAVLLSTSWSIGHMITASILTIILFTFKDTLFVAIFNNIEILVPLMLIFIGVLALLFEFDLIHFHTHTHSSKDGNISKEHTHLHVHGNKSEHGAMIGIGFIHGIASNDELLLLFTLTFGANSLEEILLGVGIFTFGVVAGMIIYSISLQYTVHKFDSKKVMRTVNVSIALISIFYAVILLMGFDGFNIFEQLGISF